MVTTAIVSDVFIPVPVPTTVSITVPPTTVPVTIVLPPSTLTLTSPTTITIPGSVVTSVIPPSTTVTISVPGTTLTLPAGTVTITLSPAVSTLTLPGSVSLSTVTAPSSPISDVIGSKTICPKSFINPTYTPAAPLPTDYTWGCPPGFICEPPQVDCNFPEAPPDPGYICTPSNCKPVPPLLPDQSTPANNTYNYSPGYFLLDPLEFMSNYDAYNGLDTLSKRDEGLEKGTMFGSLENIFSRLFKRQGQVAPQKCITPCSKLIRNTS
ncbi:MAG: hypothetical protein M1824_005002 [Vezdaea acicularis]|nr:MAG: hypothetical protein M1824_005002 [Vezdaea acicularis]